MRSMAADSPSFTLRRLFREARKGEVVFLTLKGKARFVLATADESDREVCALRANPGFMAHLAELEARARSHPRRTLEQVRRRPRAGA